MSISGINNLACKGSVADTVARLETIFRSKGIKVYSRVDQAEEARTVGLTLRPTVLLIFGDPKAGVPFMVQHPSIAIDLPLKALIWESGDGKVWLSYNSPEFLQRRHDLPAPPFEAMGTLFLTAAQTVDSNIA